MRIREADRDDYPEICKLWVQVDALHAEIQPTFFRKGPGYPRPEKGFRETLKSPRQKVLVAIVNRELVGMVQAILYDTPPQPMLVQKRRVHIDELIVDKNHRERGIGRALYEAVSAWCLKNGGTQVMLTVWEGNEIGEEFYKKLGFTAKSKVLGVDLEKE